MNDAQNALGVALIVLLIWVVVLVGAYVWWALALSRVLSKLKIDGWRAWVPVLNEIEILKLGGYPAWNIVFAFFPLAQLYWLFLRIQSVHKINAAFSRGAGMTVVGTLFPQIWASVLAWSGPAADDEVAARMAVSSPRGDTATGPLAASPFAPKPTAVGGPFASAPATSASTSTEDDGIPADTALRPSTAPAAPAAAPASAPTASVSAPPVAPGVSAPPVHPVPAAAPETPPATPVAAPAAPPAPAVRPKSMMIENPWAPKPAGPFSGEAPELVEPPESERVVPPTAPASSERPSAPATSTPVAPTAPASPPVAPPAPPVASARVAPVVPPAVVPPAAAPAPAASAPTPTPVDDDDEFGATIVVDRRPKVSWRLSVDGGHVLDVTADTVVLGRKPGGEEQGVQYLPVPDATRTLSKTHARLELRDGDWRVTDLHSTNGVILIGDDGAENLLPVGGSALISGDFVLGKVGMSLRFEDAG